MARQLLSLEPSVEPVAHFPWVGHQPQALRAMQPAQAVWTAQGSLLLHAQVPHMVPSVLHVAVPVPPAEQVQDSVVPGVQTEVVQPWQVPH